MSIDYPFEDELAESISPELKAIIRSRMTKRENPYLIIQGCTNSGFLHKAFTKCAPDMVDVMAKEVDKKIAEWVKL